MNFIILLITCIPLLPVVFAKKLKKRSSLVRYSDSNEERHLLDREQNKLIKNISDSVVCTQSSHTYCYPITEFSLAKNYSSNCYEKNLPVRFTVKPIDKENNTVLVALFGYLPRLTKINDEGTGLIKKYISFFNII